MVKLIKKVPAGLLLVPMFISALLYTFNPTFLKIGGMTQSLFAGDGVNFILSALMLCSGVSIDIKRLTRLIKYHGVLLLAKGLTCLILGLLLISFIPLEGFFGLSVVTLVVAICSLNPSIYFSLAMEVGNEDDQAAFAFSGFFGSPLFPILIFSLAAGGEMNWMPLLSTIIPLFVGIILGNLDKDFVELFAPGTTLLTPLLGWNLGQGLNLADAVSGGITGIVLVVIFYLVNSVMYYTDKKLFHTDGAIGFALISIAGVSLSVPGVLVSTWPHLAPYVTNSTAQILVGVILTSIITPIVVHKIRPTKK